MKKDVIRLLLFIVFSFTCFTLPLTVSAQVTFQNPARTLHLCTPVVYTVTTTGGAGTRVTFRFRNSNSHAQNVYWEYQSWLSKEIIVNATATATGGRATVRLKLPTTIVPGSYEIYAAVPDSSNPNQAHGTAETVTVAALPATNNPKPANENDWKMQEAWAGTTLATPFKMKVVKIVGSEPCEIPQQGVTVTFSLLWSGQGDSLSSTTAVTDANGVAETMLTLGSGDRTYYSQSIQASISGENRGTQSANIDNVRRVKIIKKEGTTSSFYIQAEKAATAAINTPGPTVFQPLTDTVFQLSLTDTFSTATFSSTGSTMHEVTTDSDGRANFEVSYPSNFRGSYRINVSRGGAVLDSHLERVTSGQPPTTTQPPPTTTQPPPTTTQPPPTTTQPPPTTTQPPANNAPVFSDGTSTTRTIAENTASGQNIGNPISATDADNDTLTYSLGGTDAASFGIVPTLGQLQTNAALDYENKASYTVTVSVSDGNSGSDSIDVTITVTDVDETPPPANNAPVFTDGTSTTRTIAENTPSGQNIGRPVSATDADNDPLTYSLEGTDAASFGIVSTSGQLQTNAALDYENKASYTVTVSVSDGNGGSDSIAVTISVTDVDETPPPANNPPVFTDGTSTTRTIAENTVSGENIGDPVSATDADNDSLTYTLSDTDAASFGIVSTTGQLQTNAALDYETKASYTVTVSVSDGNGGSDSIEVTINVTDVDETPPPPASANTPPVFTDGTSTTRTIAENTPSGQNIGDPVSATDADNDTLTYTLGGNPDAAAFGIVSTSGQLQTNAALDYENKASYTVTVSVSDGNGGSDSIEVTINVTDVDETPPPPASANTPPVFTDGTSTTRTIVENLPAGLSIGDPVSATDADNDTLTYTLGGTDAASFGIVPTLGQLQTKAALDYETKASYTVTVSVSDGRGGSDSIEVTINVTAEDETPPPPVQQPPPTDQPVRQPPPPRQPTYVPVKGTAGQIVVSEIMFEYQERHRSIPQWIELYNTTNTEINIRGWQLVWYRREPKLLDATITFATNFTIPAKTARLICSTAGRHSGHQGMQDNREIYILIRHHGAKLGQAGLQHRNRLITRGGFYLKLLDGGDTLIDEIGTVTDKASEPTWEFPNCNIGGDRSSLIRRFDDDMPRAGMERNGWIRAYDTKARPTGRYYGRQTDIGSPTYRSQVRPLPVTLSHFRAELTDAGVLIKWITDSEVDNAGFYLYRSETKAGAFKVVNAQLIQGAGTSSERNTYTWTDTTAKPNTFYYYRIEDISHDGDREKLATVQLRGFVSATDKRMTTWSELKRAPTF